MKYLEFQKVLKALREKGMIVTDEFVIVRRDIYDKSIEQMNERLRANQQMQKAVRPN